MTEKKKTTTIKIWGCRGSIPRSSAAMSKYGGSTSCVEVLSFLGTRAVLDVGSGSFELGQTIVKKFFGAPNQEEKQKYKGGHILITHTHLDHIQGFPLFTPLFLPHQSWDVYGPRGAAGNLQECLAAQMQYDYFPVNLADLGGDIRYHDLDEQTFYLGGDGKCDKHDDGKDDDEEKRGDIKVSTHYLNHPALTIGYRLHDTSTNASVCYITDHEPFDSRSAVLGYEKRDPTKPRTADDRHAEFIEGCDLLIHEAQYTSTEFPQKITWGHSTVEYAVDMAVAARVGRLALFHHDPTRTDVELDELVEFARNRVKEKEGVDWPLEIFAAAEGQVIQLEEKVVPQEESKPQPKPVASEKRRSSCTSSDVLLVYPDPSEETKAIAQDLKTSLPICQDKETAMKTALAHIPALVLVKLRQGSADSSGEAPFGLDLCRKIRASGEWGQNVPIIVDADSQEEVDSLRTVGEEAGVTDWLVKPYSKQYVRTRIRIGMLRTCRWRRADPPPDEEERLEMLHSSQILDTNPEARFDRLTRLAKEVFDVPIAIVTLIDANRQWFKSCLGLPGVTETTRDVAFCAHAILQYDILLIPDARKDDRFADNPVVTGPPHVIFYAGAPLTITDEESGAKHNFGTLCLIDQRPRVLDEKKKQILKDLRDLVVVELTKTLESAKSTATSVHRGLNNDKVSMTTESLLALTKSDVSVRKVE